MAWRFCATPPRLAHPPFCALPFPTPFLPFSRLLLFWLGFCSPLCPFFLPPAFALPLVLLPSPRRSPSLSFFPPALPPFSSFLSGPHKTVTRRGAPPARQSRPGEGGAKGGETGRRWGPGEEMGRKGGRLSPPALSSFGPFPRLLSSFFSPLFTRLLFPASFSLLPFPRLLSSPSPFLSASFPLRLLSLASFRPRFLFPLALSPPAHLVPCFLLPCVFGRFIGPCIPSGVCFGGSRAWLS